MLNRYFIRPTTVDRIRSSWIGEAIERYVGWLAEQHYAARNVFLPRARACSLRRICAEHPALSSWTTCRLTSSPLSKTG